MATPTPAPSAFETLITEAKTLFDKLSSQIAAQAANYVVIAHTDLTRWETVASTAIAAFVGYVANRVRKL